MPSPSSFSSVGGLKPETTSLLHLLSGQSDLCAIAEHKTFLQTSFHWVVSHVAVQALKLSLGAHDVIKGLGLPQSTASSDQPIDGKRAAAFPVLHDVPEHGTSIRCEDRVKVIRHNTPRAEIKTRSVAFCHFADQDRRTVVSTQNTGSMACVEQLVKRIGEEPMIVQVPFEGQIVQTRRLVLLQPRGTFRFPRLDDVFGQGIRESARDEVSGALLPPVGQILPRDVNRLRRVQRLHGRAVVSDFGSSCAGNDSRWLLLTRRCAREPAALAEMWSRPLGRLRSERSIALNQPRLLRSPSASLRLCGLKPETTSPQMWSRPLGRLRSERSIASNQPQLLRSPSASGSSDGLKPETTSR